MEFLASEAKIGGGSISILHSEIWICHEARFLNFLVPSTSYWVAVVGSTLSKELPRCPGRNSSPFKQVDLTFLHRYRPRRLRKSKDNQLATIFVYPLATICRTRSGVVKREARSISSRREQERKRERKKGKKKVGRNSQLRSWIRDTGSIVRKRGNSSDVCGTRNSMEESIRKNAASFFL